MVGRSVGEDEEWLWGSGVAGKCVNRIQSGETDSAELKLLGSLAGSLVAMRFVVDHAGAAVRILGQRGQVVEDHEQFAFFALASRENDRIVAYRS